MPTIPELASLIVTGILLQDAQMRAAGVRAEDRATALEPAVAAHLTALQNETLVAAEGATVALARALEMKGR